jgi:uncharacterized protein (TIGR00369 family)
MNDAPRERLIRWHDPAIALRAMTERRLSGLEFLRGMLAGEIPPPPVAALLGFTVDSVSPGRIVFGFEPEEYHYNPNGVVHGGIAASILDTATGCAVISLLPFGITCATLELKVNYIRSLSSDSPRLRAVGTVLHLGRRSALAEGRLLTGDDALAAHATATLMIFPPEETHRGRRAG